MCETVLILRVDHAAAGLWTKRMERNYLKTKWTDRCINMHFREQHLTYAHIDNKCKNAPCGDFAQWSECRTRWRCLQNGAATPAQRRLSWTCLYGQRQRCSAPPLVARTWADSVVMWKFREMCVCVCVCVCIGTFSGNTKDFMRVWGHEIYFFHVIVHLTQSLKKSSSSFWNVPWFSAELQSRCAEIQ